MGERRSLIKSQIEQLEEDNRNSQYRINELTSELSRFRGVNGVNAVLLPLDVVHKRAKEWTHLKARVGVLTKELEESFATPTWHDLRSKIVMYQLKTGDALIEPSKLLEEMGSARGAPNDKTELERATRELLIRMKEAERRIDSLVVVIDQLNEKEYFISGERKPKSIITTTEVYGNAQS